MSDTVHVSGDSVLRLQQDDKISSRHHPDMTRFTGGKGGSSYSALSSEGLFPREPTPDSSPGALGNPESSAVLASQAARTDSNNLVSKDRLKKKNL